MLIKCFCSSLRHIWSGEGHSGSDEKHTCGTEEDRVGIGENNKERT